jgi:hypothetical protein
MASDARDRITEIYHAALTRPPEERRVFLNDACQGDEALRRELDSLLGYQSAVPRFLERPSEMLAGDVKNRAFIHCLITNSRGVTR